MPPKPMELRSVQCYKRVLTALETLKASKCPEDADEFENEQKKIIILANMLTAYTNLVELEKQPLDRTLSGRTHLYFCLVAQQCEQDEEFFEKYVSIDFVCPFIHEIVHIRVFDTKIEGKLTSRFMDECMKYVRVISGFCTVNNKNEKNRLTSSGAKNLGNFIANAKVLQILNFAHDDRKHAIEFHSDEFEHIVDGLRFNSSVTHVLLNNNNTNMNDVCKFIYVCQLRASVLNVRLEVLRLDLVLVKHMKQRLDYRWLDKMFNFDEKTGIGQQRSLEQENACISPVA